MASRRFLKIYEPRRSYVLRERGFATVRPPHLQFVQVRRPASISCRGHHEEVSVGAAPPDESTTKVKFRSATATIIDPQSGLLLPQATRLLGLAPDRSPRQGSGVLLEVQPPGADPGRLIPPSSSLLLSPSSSLLRLLLYPLLLLLQQGTYTYIDKNIHKYIPI